MVVRGLRKSAEFPESAAEADPRRGGDRGDREGGVPSTAEALFTVVGLEPSGPVLFGEPVPEQQPGVYIVAHTGDPRAAAPEAGYEPEFAVAEIRTWLDTVPSMMLEGVHPTPDDVCAHLREFWLPDEPVLYIGQTGSGLRKRLRQYYRTPLGMAKPHAGGYWLKTLTDYGCTFVFWAATPHSDPERVEEQMLAAFVRGVDTDSRRLLRDPKRPFPFANLEHPRGNVKRHGITCPHLRG